MAVIPVFGFLSLSVILLGTGIFLALTRKNAVVILLGVELILNAANLNFIGFSQYYGIEGQVAALLVMVLAASEAALGLALIMHLFHHYGTVNLDEIQELSQSLNSSKPNESD